MTFKASLDRLSIGITIAVGILFAGILGLLLPLVEEDVHLVPLEVALLLCAIFLGSYLFRTRAYQVSSRRLTIVRPWKNKILDRLEILSVEMLTKKDLTYSIRVWGSGGLFGYYGKFYNTRIGSMTWYATNRSNPVLLNMRGGTKLLLTPDDPGAFMEALVPVSNPVLQPA